MEVSTPVELFGQFGQLVVMRREQGASTDALMNMLDHGPRQRQTVVGCGAAADFVENDKAARSRGIENHRRLSHLDHERGPAAREIIGGGGVGGTTHLHT